MSAVLSDVETSIYEMVNFMFVCPIVGTFGILANIINIVIFYKQGFKNTVNIGFFGLAISDLICLLALQWAAFCLNRLFVLSGIPWYSLEVMYLSGAWPHIIFSRITAFVTVYITAERYISIAFPLKVQNIITPKRTAFILCLIYFLNIATLFPEYATSYLGWRFVPSKNKTLIGIIFTSSRIYVEGIVFVLHSLFGMASFLGVIILTTLLVSKLQQSSNWRKEVTSNYNKLIEISNRDKKTVKMVVFIACVLIACYTPGVIIALATFIVGPEFNIRGHFINICEAMWSIAVSFQCVNSSVNIFVYYTMSSKYRQTFNDVILKRNNFQR